MKNFKIILILCVLISVSLSSNAQIGDLKKGISKVKEKSSNNNKPAESDQSKTTTTPATKTETPAKTETPSTQPSDNKSVDFKELETKKMEWTSAFERIEKRWDKPSYQEYTALKSEYEQFYKEFASEYKKNRGSDHADSYTQKIILKVDGYYTEKVSDENMLNLKNKLKRSFDDKDWTVYPSDRLNDIETAEKMIADIKNYLIKTDADFNEYVKTVIAQKEKIIAYVDGGGLAKRDAEIEKKMVQTRALHAAGMTDASVNATVSSKIDKAKYGTVLKVVITSNSWEIERNDFGIPLLKFVRVDIATKKADGKCYFIKGSVAQKHEGGGRYGDKYLNIYYTEGEMNCNNVK